MPGPRGRARRIRILVTGAGGPAAIAAMKSLQGEDGVELIAAGMDPWAAGLYLVPERTLIPAGAAPEFTDAVLATCLTLGVTVILPTGSTRRPWPRTPSPRSRRSPRRTCTG
jgi:carbamoyl-phosphate synthase large subunit